MLPDGATDTFQRNDAGDVTEHTDPMGYATDFTYSTSGDLVQTDFPDGAFVALEESAFAVRGDGLLRWTPEGYDGRKRLPRAAYIDVLTPPAILDVLSAGYRPHWHPSVQETGGPAATS